MHGETLKNKKKTRLCLTVSLLIDC